ncbi:diguanylate cyclase domain-containing protein [uncultured Ruminococcus sp.]|uniref:diguanylate cyclase domain-containing protein n=1 Tax=uncultured Ruminococcus sp. TaxID=165186 RepID=UPI002639932C|nr:diguanylate cyclase [uncultured Ruminococcus sp.]
MSNEKIINIAVAVAGIDEEYQQTIISGINKAARENKVNISYFTAFGGMLPSKRFDIGEYSIYRLIDFERFDGAILMTNTISDSEVKEYIIKKVRASGIPSVVFDCSDYPEFCNISIDNSMAMNQIVEHIITEHGAKVLNYISGPLNNPEAKARLNSFMTVMNKHGLEVDDKRIYYGEFRSQDGKKAIEEFAASGLPLPDAVICANDAMALTAATTLEKMGYKIPEDIMITGFDNTYNARNFCPALTSVGRPLEEVGYQACKILTDVVNGKELPSGVSLEATPVFTESCGCGTEDADDFKAYKKRSYTHTETVNAHITMINRLTARLAETEEEKEHTEALCEFIEELECERFSLCLTEDWKDSFDSSEQIIVHDDGEYAAFMTSPLIWDKGETRTVGFFPSSEMYPEQFETGGNVSYFMPLHFRERCLGYYIVTNGDFPIYSLLCHSLTMNISNSLENIRKLFRLNKAMDELNKLYVIDPLCNVYNRNGFINIADDMFKECVEKKMKVMLSFIDMDGLKFINDNYGHNEGDFAIQRLASVIQECCGRRSICARLGGDEFVIFEVGVTSSSAEALQRRFDIRIDNMNSIIRKPYVLSASIGSVIAMPDENTTLYSIIQEADDKMYEIKKTRKNARKSEKIEGLHTNNEPKL